MISTSVAIVASFLGAAGCAQPDSATALGIASGIYEVTEGYGWWTQITAWRDAGDGWTAASFTGCFYEAGLPAADQIGYFRIRGDVGEFRLFPEDGILTATVCEMRS